MSKLYFAKYLSVEGEFEEIHFCRTCSSLGGGIRHCAHPEECGQVETKKRPKQKLFLCSRDIQVGDEVLVPYPSGNAKMTIENSYYRNVAIENKGFKVIGEISPEATWVKEGDEFNEKELGYLECIGAPVYDFSVVKRRIEQKYDDFYIAIMGPCGHFH